MLGDTQRLSGYMDYKYISLQENDHTFGEDAIYMPQISKWTSALSESTFHAHVYAVYVIDP